MMAFFKQKNRQLNLMQQGTTHEEPPSSTKVANDKGNAFINI